ncbi:uncharacterized protein LOC132902972 [Amyelois transitella]|uniref:uncharacterized protein LOC132902972 n=1 Tax=Amyelois transitella TaxID=680683 RepID=UPI00299026DB|nr:uncharacterized protein LOC132902972 [Amyelois transitella]
MPPQKKTREEVLERKKELERLRYQRLKNDPQKREEMKEKERLKYQKKKEKGLRKLVRDMTPREHRTAKKNWKKHCTDYRARKKTLKETTNAFVRDNTPSSETEISAPPTTDNSANKKRKRHAKLLREKANRDKDNKILEYKRKVEKYKKRLSRLEKTINQNKDETPNTKINRMIDDSNSRKEIVKKALFGEVMNKQLKENYSQLKTQKDKQIFSKVVAGTSVHKYKLWTTKDSAINYKMTKKWKPSPSLEMPKRTRIDKISKRCAKVIREFYEDDSNSRLGAGKKEFITRNSIKHQKRYLQDTVLSLYKKFVASNFKISYQMFCRLRPFWVVKPKAQDRDTCLCVTHANIDLKLSGLHAAKILSYNSYQKLLENLCCDRYNVECLSRKCLVCNNRTPAYNEFDDNKPIQYKKWVSEKQEYLDPKSKKPKLVTKHLKKTLTLRPRELIHELHADLDKFFCHQRNIVHQFNAIKHLKENLGEEDILIHMDFSENYCTKYGEEIQPFHFGGSRTQISIHTVVVYLKNSIQSYATISKNLTHSPSAIWAHLQPIFRAIQPGIKYVHFLSDGPVTQYRNKTMFFVLASRLSKDIPNLQGFSWNYSEAGHGKGAPDGVGATCKRTADAVVAAGGDVDTLEQFVEVIQARCPGIIFHTINDEDIQSITDAIEKTSKLKSFNGTLKVHQITGISTSPAVLTMRSLSCFCPNTCQHYKIGTINYNQKMKLRVQDIYTESETSSSEDDNALDMFEIEPSYATKPRTDSPVEEMEAGPSRDNNDKYNCGDYVLVKLQSKHTEYRYVAVINKIDEEDGEFTVTFLKLCDKEGLTFKVDEEDVSDIAFEQIIKKLTNPDLILKGKRIFYKFNTPVNIFEQ